MDEVVRFRMKAEDKAKLETEAQKVGMSVSAFIRLLITNWTDGITFEREKRAPTGGDKGAGTINASASSAG